MATLPFGLSDDRGDRDDAWLTCQGPGEGGESGVGVGRGQLGDQLERSAEPRPETLGEQVVGLQGGGAGRVAAGVVQAEVEAEDRAGR